jgi:hypothetical protein
MKHQRHFERASDVALREAARISALISDLDRVVRILDCDIDNEEERARVSDPFDAAYPILARTLAARRDNLKDTIAALERRLASLLERTEIAFVTLSATVRGPPHFASRPTGPMPVVNVP